MDVWRRPGGVSTGDGVVRQRGNMIGTSNLNLLWAVAFAAFVVAIAVLLWAKRIALRTYGVVLSVGMMLTGFFVLWVAPGHGLPD